MFYGNKKHRFLTAKSHLTATVRAPLLIALIIASLFFGVLGLWSVTAPLASAALAPGLISPEGYRRTIQHLEGGIIRELRVKDGDLVQSGTDLIILEKTQARSIHRIQQSQYLAMKAQELRLLAEAEGRLAVNWNGVPHTDGWQQVVADQNSAFLSRLATHDSQRRLLKQHTVQLQEEIAGLNEQIDSQSRQLDLYDDELDGVQTLMKQGLARRPRLLDLQRQQAALEGQRAANRSNIARARQAIGETKLKIMALETQRQDEATQRLGEARNRIADLQERLASSRDKLKRTVITAPISGTVINLRFKTAGGVIQSGDAILDLVPLEEDLLVDARVAPADIDVVRTGMSAEITLSAFPQRHLPRLRGQVRSISADLVRDEQNEQAFYMARIEIDPKSLTSLGSDISLLPGMSADTMMFTGTRTLLNYLLNPLLDSIHRSFRES